MSSIGRVTGIGRPFWWAAFLASSLILASGIFAGMETRRLNASGGRALHTLETLRQIESLRALLVDAESGQRGYLLTGEDSYLEPYLRATREVEGETERLDRMVADSPEQHARVRSLRDSMGMKLGELAESIDLRRTKGSAAALALVHTSIGRHTMDVLRALLDELTSEEQAAAARDLEQRRSESMRALLATGALGGVSMMIFGGVMAALDRALRRQRAAELTATENRERLRVTLASIGDAVIATDSAGRVVFMNSVAETLTGWDDAEAHGRALEEVFRIVNEYTRASVESPVDKVLREGKIVGLANHTILIGRDGKERPIDDSGAPIRDAGSDIMGVVLVFRDVTARRAAERARDQLVLSESARTAAEAASRAKDEFLAIVSHELRSPLAAAASWVDLLRLGALDERQRERALGTIDRNLHQQALLIDDLLDVSRIVSGKLTVERVPLDVTGLVETAVGDAREKAEAKGVTLRFVAPAVDAVALGDRARLAQVFANLLDNAIKFTPSGGSVDVAMAVAGGRIEVDVRDSGRGIDAAFLPHVFERFRQDESATSRGQVGLGLGLAIVRHLVELHEGTITARSEGEGRGATFRVVLPATEQAPDAKRMRGTDAADALAGVVVLLVDDHDDTREALAFLLRSRGAKVSEADSTAAALERCAAERPAIVLSDIGMPGTDGLVLVEELRRRDAERGTRTPAIAITGFASAQDRQRALAAGYDEHVAKPVDFAQLFDAMRRLLGA